MKIIEESFAMLPDKTVITEAVIKLDSGEIIYSNPNAQTIKTFAEKGAKELRIMRDKNSGRWFMWDGQNINHFGVSRALDPEGEGKERKDSIAHMQDNYDGLMSVQILKKADGNIYRIFHDGSSAEQVQQNYEKGMKDPRFVRMFDRKPIYTFKQLDDPEFHNTPRLKSEPIPDNKPVGPSSIAKTMHLKHLGYGRYGVGNDNHAQYYSKDRLLYKTRKGQE